MGKLSHIKKAIEGAKRRVYQGSPHKHDGKLDPSKIGTGEGAQAYGYGHYLAENPDVAKGYQDRLSDGMLETPDGEVFDVSDLEHLNVRARLRKNKGDVQKTLDSLVGVADDAPVETQAMLARDIAKLEQYKASGLKSGGHLYEFDLPESAIDNMLDWDAPLSEQPEAVRGAINQLPGEYKRFFRESNIPGSSPKAGEAYASLADHIGRGDYVAGQKFVSEELNSLGIPGIKYHDGMSRAAGEGTRNFVIFPGNEDMVKAVSRNGEKLSAAALAPLAGIGLMGTFSEDSQAGVGGTIKAAGKAMDMPEVAADASRLYHGGKVDVVNDEGVYGGVFASGDYGSARAHGPVDQYIDIPDSQIANNWDLDELESVDLLRRELPNATEDELDVIYDAIVFEKEGFSSLSSPSGFDYEPEPAKIDRDRLGEIFGLSDISEIENDAQRIRGLMARNLGYKAVKMSDEHGTSYMILPGARFNKFVGGDPDDSLAGLGGVGLGGAGVLGAAALSPEDAMAAELDAIALQGERMRSLQGAWRSPEKRDKWKALKSGLYDNLVAPALEGMAAVNRGAVDTLNFVGPDQVNAILQLSGSEKRVPTLNNIPGIDEATAGNYMQEGLPRDIVRTGGEFLSPL